MYFRTAVETSAAVTQPFQKVTLYSVEWKIILVIIQGKPKLAGESVNVKHLTLDDVERSG